MPVHKLILRIDYKVNFSLWESLGAALRILNEPKNLLWSTYGDNREKRQVFVAYQDPNFEPTEYRFVAVEPTSIAAVFESVKGVDLSMLLSDETIVPMIRCIGALCEKFEISDLTRLGLRIYYCNDLREGLSPSVLDAFQSAVDHRLVDAIDDTVGRPFDYGFVFDGRADDKIEYHLRLGPYLKGEQGKYFENIAATRFASANSPDFICDLDLYETDFSLSRISLLKWLAPLVNKQRDLVCRAEKAITHLCEG